MSSQSLSKAFNHNATRLKIKLIHNHSELSSFLSPHIFTWVLTGFIGFSGRALFLVVKVSTLGVKSLVVSCVGSALGVRCSLLTVTTFSTSSPAPKKRKQDYPRTSHEHKVNNNCCCFFLRGEAGELFFFSWTLRILPEPDPELKSSSSSGYPPEPVSSR